MKTIQLNDTTFWIGKVDDRKVPFHRLVLEKGTTYNSYLLKTEKPTVIDTVDFSFGKEFVDHVKSEIDPMDIAYIIINHSEPDHSGGLGALARAAKNAVIVCTEPAVYELKEMYRLHERDFLVVDDGDSLDIGGKTLQFIRTPYLHTEETMLTYAVEDKTIFPCDVFSTHVATYDLFNDLATEDITPDFDVYYQLIMHPHRRYVRRMIDKIKDLDIDMIAPSHGYILRENAQDFVGRYDAMSQDTESTKRVAVVYSTLTGRTKGISQEIQRLLEDEKLTVDLVDVNKTTIDDVLEAIRRADAVFFGTSTKYADMIGGLEPVLKRPDEVDGQGKLAAAYGSFGWSGEGIEVVQDYLLESSMEALNTSHIIKTTGMIDVHFPVRIRFSMDEADKAHLDRAVGYVVERLYGQ